MLTPFQWILLICIVIVAFIGGYAPLFKREEAQRQSGFSLGQAFAAGVFLALCLTIMLPAAFQLLRQAFPDVHYPIASIIAILAFLFLLALEQVAKAMIASATESQDTYRSPASIPIVMTVMMMIPSFFLGTALGFSDPTGAFLIFVAIVAHKGTAAFALALQMVRSTLTRPQVFVTFGLFALATPFGILVGGDVREFLMGETMVVVKGVIFAFAAGTFLYMGTIHEMEHAPLIEHCSTRRGFVAMLTGFALTALIRLLLGEAHHA